jgi:hypothetical protein
MMLRFGIENKGYVGKVEIEQNREKLTFGVVEEFSPGIFGCYRLSLDF